MADKRSIYQFESGQGQQNSLMLMDNPDASASSGYTTEKLSIGELGAVIGAILYTQLLDTNVKNIFGGINELFARCMNIADDYDDTETYYTGDYVFYQNVLYKCNDDSVTGTWDATKWDITTVADEINEVKSGFAVDSANSPNAVGVNGTYQIPANVLAHTFIIVACRRGGYGNSIMFKKDELLTFDNGFTFLGTGGGYYTLKCSNTGLLTVTNITNLSEPYILVTGFM